MHKFCTQKLHHFLCYNVLKSRMYRLNSKDGNKVVLGYLEKQTIIASVLEIKFEISILIMAYLLFKIYYILKTLLERGMKKNFQTVFQIHKIWLILPQK